MFKRSRGPLNITFNRYRKFQDIRVLLIWSFLQNTTPYSDSAAGTSSTRLPKQTAIVARISDRSRADHVSSSLRGKINLYLNFHINFPSCSVHRPLYSIFCWWGCFFGGVVPELGETTSSARRWSLRKCFPPVWDGLLEEGGVLLGASSGHFELARWFLLPLGWQHPTLGDRLAGSNVRQFSIRWWCSTS